MIKMAIWEMSFLLNINNAFSGGIATCKQLDILTMLPCFLWAGVWPLGPAA